MYQTLPCTCRFTPDFSISKIRPNLNTEKFAKWPKIDIFEFLQNFGFMFNHEKFRLYNVPYLICRQPMGNFRFSLTLLAYGDVVLGPTCTSRLVLIEHLFAVLLMQSSCR